MKSNKGNFQQIVLAFLVLFIHSIAVFGDAENQSCNRTCGSRTVAYPFGFSGPCPYMLECSESGGVCLKGFPVLNFTNSSIIIQPWQSKNRKCYEDSNILSSHFKKQFGLTWRNILLADNCTKHDCSIEDLRSIGSNYNVGRENCRGNISGSITCLTSNSSGWFPWKSIENSTCKHFLTSVILDKLDLDSYISLDIGKLDLGWWVNGKCRSNSCSTHAICSQFENPNNETVHSCHCNQGFEGDGFLEGARCQRVGSILVVQGRSRGKKLLLVAICGIVAGISATVVGIVLLYCSYQKYCRSLETRRSTERLMSTHGIPLNIPVYTYREMEIATKSFSSEERLGRGGFGTVYAGKLPDKTVVAVKQIRHTDNQGLEQVLNEINLLSSVDHPNLVRLLGCCLEKEEPILVYEFMPNGTLSQHLQREKGEGLSWKTRVTIAAETAHALAYLHSAINPPIYHRDVKTSNILLDYGFNAKVADFGLSRLVLTEVSHISTRPQGTPGYLDPQYHGNFHLTDKSDVYSFGVVLVEIITALKVVDFSRNDSEINLAFLAVKKIGEGCVDEIIDPFLEVDKDTQVRAAVHKVAELAFRCLAFDRDARPTMVEVAQELEFIEFDKSSVDFSDSTSRSITIDSRDSISPALHKISGVVVQNSGSGSQCSW